MFCWRGDVGWDIGTQVDPKLFSFIDSNEFILAIPDLTREMTFEDIFHNKNFEMLSSERARNAVFHKIMMKLSGKVRWTAGLVMERNCGRICDHCGNRNVCRLYDFKPHYDVHLKAPEFCDTGNKLQVRPLLFWKC